MRTSVSTSSLRFVLAFLLTAFSVQAHSADKATVGSKRFTESYVLGEIITQTLTAQGIKAEHRQGLGNTGILEQALSSGAVDVYPEYTGTIVRELLKREGNPSLVELNTWLAPRGLKAAVPLGFNNTYALAMLDARANELGISTISDLLRAEAAGLRLGLSHEFLARADGWPALKAAYKLPYAAPSGLDHGLAYDAVSGKKVDLIDIYSTDAKVDTYKLRVLKDDLNFFPRYDAVLLMRMAFDATPLQRLEGRINAQTMIAMNAQAELGGQSFADVAKRFLASGNAGNSSTASAANAASGAAQTAPARATFMQRLFDPDFGKLALEHLLLVFGSLAMAIVVGVPLGFAAWRWPGSSAWLLGAVGVVQTVPSLALLSFLIALIGGIGLLPALLALFIYALLPIVSNTCAGLKGVSTGQAQAASSLGLTRWQSLLHVQLPQAAPVMLAGVKTAAVINVGTATLAAFVGAGGFGERIVSGLAVNDTQSMLAGAVPAAVLALGLQGLFNLIERRITPGAGR
jgi:osmoprotectant transport system permease protein